MATRISGKGLVSGLAALASGVINSFTLLATRLIGYTTSGGGGSSYYTTTVGTSKDVLSFFPFFYGNQDKEYYYTDDLVNVNIQDIPFYLPPDTQNKAVTFNNKTIFALGGNQYSESFNVESSDGQNWTNSPSNQQYNIFGKEVYSIGDMLIAPYGMRYANNGEFYGMAHCLDGITWQVRGDWQPSIATYPSYQYFFKLDNGNLVLVVHTPSSDVLKVYRSTDGMSWSTETLTSVGTMYTYPQKTGDAVVWITSAGTYTAVDGYSTNLNTGINSLSNMEVTSRYDAILMHSTATYGSYYITDNLGATWQSLTLQINNEPNGASVSSYAISSMALAGYGWFITLVYPSSQTYYIGYAFVSGSTISISIDAAIPNSGEASVYRYDIKSSELLNKFSGKLHAGASFKASGSIVGVGDAKGLIYYTVSNPAINSVDIYVWASSQPFGIENFKILHTAESGEYPPYIEVTELKYSTLQEVQISIGDQGSGGAEILAPVDVYTVPVTKVTTIDQVTLKNNSADTITYDLGILDSGVDLTDLNANRIDQPILAGQTVTATTPAFENLSAGKRIVVLPSAVDVVEVKVYGTETDATPVYQFTIADAGISWAGIDWRTQQRYFYMPVPEDASSSLYADGSYIDGGLQSTSGLKLIYIDGVEYEYFTNPTGSTPKYFFVYTGIPVEDLWSTTSEENAAAAALNGKTAKFY